MKDFWTLESKDTMKVGNISYSEATYSAKVRGGTLYKFQWFMTDSGGNLISSGSNMTSVSKKELSSHKDLNGF